MHSNILHVFPTSRAIRTYISQDESNRLLYPLLSIDEFFFKSIDVGNLSFIDEEHQFLLLKEATQVKNFNKLGISNNFNDFLKQSEYILRFFNELNAENISIQSIKKADTYEFYEEHLSILEAIYEKYTKLLKENNYIDTILLPKYYKINHDFLSKFDSITIFFEGYLTHFEFSLITAIAQYLPLHIQLKTTVYNKKSYEKFTSFGFVLDEGFEYILDISNKTILETKPSIPHPHTIEIKAFSQRTHQIGFVKNAINAMLQKGFKPNEIVLIVPDESFVQLLQLFDNENYFNYAMGKDIKTSLLYTHSYALYQYLNEFERKDTDYIQFLHIEESDIITALKPFWNEPITLLLFKNLTAYLLAQESSDEISEKFNEECYKLEKLFFNYKEVITLKEAYKFLLQRIGSITIDDTNGGPITVMGLLETRGISYKGIIIVDFNEEVVPKKSIKDKFLSTQVKKHSFLPTRKDRENLQKFYYCSLCNNANEIYVSYVKNDTNNISRFATELFKVKTDETIYDAAYKSILYTPKHLIHFNDVITLDIDLSKREWSATSLKTYLQCKRKYYLQYIAQIKEHYFNLKPKKQEIGIIIHSILEQFYSKHSSINETFSNTILNDYFKLYQHQNPFMILDFEIWKRKLEHFIENEKKDFSTKQKNVYKTEMPFKISFEGITLKGVIDRVDIGKEFLEIIDYKTSSSLSIDTPKNYEKASDFQLEFYYLAMKEYIKNQPFYNYRIKPYYYDLQQSLLLEESALEEKIELLKEKLNELKTTDVNFEKCEDKTLCSYCNYSIICNI